MKTKMGPPNPGKIKPGKIPQDAAKDKAVPRPKSLGISAPALAGTVGDGSTIRIEKIENGYLLHHSNEGPKGDYQRKTVFHPSKPSINVATPKLPKKRT